MSKLSDYLENRLVDHLFRSTALAKPSGIHLALGTAATDSSFTELSGGNYSRISLGLGNLDWTPDGLGGVYPIGEHNSAVATGNWGDITKWALFDAASGGNMLFYGDIAHGCRVYTGEKFTLPSGGLTVGFD